MYDVVVIGARCAGSATAMLLARAGARVLLLDRADFPSDTISTHLLHPAGVARLAEWGLLESLLDTGCPPVPEMTFTLAGELTLTGTPLPCGDSAYCLAPRRTALDDLLVTAAVAAGAEFRPGCSFRRPVWTGDRVTGVEYFHGSTVVTEHAALVVGADGKHSGLATSLHLPHTRDLGMASCLFYGYWSGVPERGVRLYRQPGESVLAFPTNAERHCVAVGWPHARFDEVKHDLTGHFLATVHRLAPELRAELAEGTREGRIVGSADLPNFYRQSSGPGWALVGDAAHTRDPACAHGIGHAFDDAAALATAVTATLDDRPETRDRAVTSCLTDRRRRTERTLLGNLAFAEWQVPDNLLPVLREAQHDPERVTEFLGVFAGRVSLADFLGADGLATRFF
ncbi:2-polyprenyl-6-methoxyphenol hydroxylase-like FAD-dependent oxidoreductase [Crossiella equi]|uniref:2-polyprenyl-6-methoxyphenol hydroxylase-like FAD-dependent oxidoreductase n=1 Tax=Crossiella equi TaxID=130796 RepID=A0ABS5AT47_9PSEU|nr:NAD(P)/FAD-dependent oxidoreductase [Crossiella equi]MBP2479379.1 2-polyprenyl-6-methoxyphenol hydroxylase-like FAD-dependent oxidoreductase [Crossiella equi]